MPIQVNNFNIEITAGPTTITLPISDPYDLYTVTTTGAIVIGGTTDIVSSGTLIEGIKYVFKWTGNITSGALTFMGMGLPTDLYNKTCLIEVYYNGTSWELTYLPDLAQTDVVSEDAVVKGVYSVIDYDFTNYSTANAIGEQLLVTLEIPANTFQTEGDGFKLRVVGVASANPLELKTLTVRSVTGATTIDLFENSIVTDIEGVFLIDVYVPIENIGTGAIFPMGTLMCNTGTAVTEVYSPNNPITGFDHINGVQYIRVYATETTPTGSQITIRSAILERLRA